MSLAVAPAQVPWAGRVRARIGCAARERPNTLNCLLLLSLTAVMLLPGSLTLPMELWDESRNAVNALEIARDGHWMVPTFAFAPDHWNTKPPLLIWIMAALLRTGMEPMLALRLPSIVATMASVLLAYAAGAVLLRDRLAGLMAGLLLTSSLLFLGDHVGRTGDYDALLSLLTLGYVLCAGRAIEAPRETAVRWIIATAILLFLALLTKDVAAGMAGPGLLAYAIARRRLLAVLRDWRYWAAIIGVAAGFGCWLALRESLDPGYIAASMFNDVGGRFLTDIDSHAHGPTYYLSVLFHGCEPTVLLLPMALAAREDPDPARRRLCLLLLLSAASWLLAISASTSKCYWYAAPIAPLFAIAVGAGTATFLRRRGMTGATVIRPIVLTMLITFWYLNIKAPDPEQAYVADQSWYGPFLAEARQHTPLNGAMIVDRGLPNDAGFAYYNPIARFFVEDAASHGEYIRLATPGTPVARATPLITCDPGIRDALRARHSFMVLYGDSRCVLGRLAAEANGHG